PLVRLSRGMPLVVDRCELGPIGTNCYVVRTERGAAEGGGIDPRRDAAPRPGRGAREAVVIDPGGDAATLRLELARMGVAVAGILVTHTHYDHIGAVADLAEATRAHVSIS